MIILRIFLTFLKIGAFSFGGGYAVLALIEKEIVKTQGWLSPGEFIDLVAISQITPGPIAVNSSTYAGYKAAGLMGALAGTLGVTLVSFILIVAVASKLETMKDSKSVQWVFSGLRPAVVGLIGSAAFSISKSAIVDPRAVLIAVCAFAAIAANKAHPILVIAISGILGVLIY